MTSLAPLSIDMYLPALPFLQGFFHADASAIQLTLASFFVAFALGQLFYGPLSDAYGRKKPLYAGVILFIFASIGCVWAKSVEMLIFLRFLQALGACTGIVIARAIVSDLFRAEEAAGIYSSMMMISGVAPIVAPIIGGSILGTIIGWEAIFYLLAFLGMIVLLSSSFYRALWTFRARLRNSLWCECRGIGAWFTNQCSTPPPLQLHFHSL